MADTKQQLSEDLVIDTAAEIADREGLDAVTLSRVARDLGSTQPALYRYVDSYDQLVRALGLRGREILATRLIEAGVGVAGDDAVMAMAQAWRQLVADHPGLYAATDRYPCAGDAELEAAVNRIVKILSDALVAYELSGPQRIDVARTLRSSFHGFSHLELGDGHPHDQNLDESFRQLVNLICRGIHTAS